LEEEEKIKDANDHDNKDDHRKRVLLPLLRSLSHCIQR